MSSIRPVLALPVAVVLSLFAGVRHGAAQATAAAGADVDLAKEIGGGTPLVHVARGTPLVLGTTRDGWTQATITGWIAAAALQAAARDGFDVAVTPAAGSPLRSQPVDGQVLGTARVGALFNRADSQKGWVHVSRTGWIPATAVTSPPPAPAAGVPAAAQAPGETTVLAGTVMALTAGGPPAATLQSPIPVKVLEHQGGWAHVRVDAWVRDGTLGTGAPPEGITAAQLRANPDKYVGDSVEWTVQVLAIEKADELRPELTLGEPYVLARGPLPETGFVYLAVTAAQAEMFRRLGPLARVRVRATIRAGRSKFLPTPVLNFVQRIE